MSIQAMCAYNSSGGGGNSVICIVAFQSGLLESATYAPMLGFVFDQAKCWHTSRVASRRLRNRRKNT
jgi:hypothetical protein